MVDNDVVTSASETPVVIPSKPPPQADAAKPMVLGPIADLLRSRKFVVTALVLIGVFALVAIGRLSWEQSKEVLMVVIPAWLISHAAENGLTAKRKL